MRQGLHDSNFQTYLGRKSYSPVRLRLHTSGFSEPNLLENPTRSKKKDKVIRQEVCA